MTTLDLDDDVWVLDLGEGDIRFTPETVAEISAALDEVAAWPGPVALVTTASGKIWHNGLDLEAMGQEGFDVGGFVRSVEGLFGRLLHMPVPSVATIQGHAFAAGAMFALAHDLRVMRTDRGYLCLPEVDLGLPFTPGMAALIADRLPAAARHRMAVLGERLGGFPAMELGAVDEVGPPAELRQMGLARARDLAPKAGPTIVTLRKTFATRAVEELPDPGYGP